MQKHKYVTILAVNSTNQEICILDQVAYVTAYKKLYGNGGPILPLSGHYSCMRKSWPNWTIISKDLWEQKYGKIVYP